MTSPGGRPVARVSVRVLPDTSDFDRELRRELANLPDVRVDVGFDVDHEQLRRELEEIQAEVKIPVSFGLENIRDDIQRATAGQRGRVPVDLDVDENDLDKRIKDAIKGIDDIRLRNITIDQTRLQAEAERIRKQLDELDNRRVTPHVELLQASFQAQLREIKAELSALDARKVEVEVELEANTAQVRREIFNIQGLLNEVERNPVQIRFDMEEFEIQRRIAEVTASLEKLDGKEVTPELELEAARFQADLAKYRIELERFDQKRVKAIAELDVDTRNADSRIQAYLARLRDRQRIQLDIDVDLDSFGRVVTGTANTLAGAIGGVVRGMFSSFSEGSSEFFRGFESGLGNMKNGLAQAAQVAAQLATVLLKVSAVTTALTVAGAAVTAAWGAVATAIAAIPSAIGLLGVPLATVMLGLDGVKAAAKTIKPEFDALKASVSETFEKGLVPVLKQVVPLFEPLRVGANGVAQSLVDMADKMVKFLNEARSVAFVGVLFNNVKQAITDLTPGIIDIVDGFIMMAAQKGAIDALTNTVNVFGREFKASVLDLMGNGILTRAFDGLRGSLEALTRGFVQLVDNGLRVFAAAAPGVNAFLNELTNFFERFNWERLGSAVSGVFNGLAASLRSVPAGVIEQITVGLEGAARAIQSPGFQKGLQDLIVLFGQFVAAIPSMIDAAGRAATALSGLVDVIRATAQFVKPAFDLMIGVITGQGAKIGQALIDMAKAGVDAAPLMEQGMAKIADAALRGGPQISSAVTTGLAPVGPAVAAGIQQAFHPAVPAVQAELSKLGPAVTTSLRNADLAIEAGVRNWEATARSGAAPVAPAVGAEMSNVAPAANTALAPLAQLEAVQNMQPQFTTAALNSMNALAVGVAAGMPIVQQNFQAGMDTISTNVNSSFTLIGQGFTIGMQSLADLVTMGMAGLQTAFSTGFLGISAQVGTFIAPIRTNLNIAMLGLQQEVTNGMIQVGLAFQTGFAGIAFNIGALIAPVRANLNIAMLGLVQEVTNGMIQLQLAFNAGFANIAFGVGAAIAPIRANLNIAMAGLVQEVANGMIQLKLAFDAGLATVGAGVATSFAGITATVQAGMASMAGAVSSGMPAIAAAFNFRPVQDSVGRAFLAMIGTVRTGMQGIANEIRTGIDGAQRELARGLQAMARDATNGMREVTTQVTRGMDTVVRAVRDGGRDIGVAAQAAMTDFTAKIQAGMIRANSLVTTNTQNMVTAVRNWQRDTEAAARDAMRNFERAVVDGMDRSVAAVRAGATRMVAELRGREGEFFSIGVAMMNGLESGIRSRASAIAAAAAAVVRQAIAAARAAAAVASPSKRMVEVGAAMGDGLALGLDRSRDSVRAAAEDLADEVLKSADRINGAFELGPANLGRFTANVERQMGAGLANLAGQGGSTVVQNFNFGDINARADEDTPAVIARRMRTLQAMGVFT